MKNNLVTNLNIRTAVQFNAISTKLVKEFGYLFSKYIATSINRCIAEGTFVNSFKKSEVRPIYKKDGRTGKSNYRPVSVLSNVSKIYKRCIYEQIYSYFDKIFSKNQCGFRQGFNTQHILLAMIEKMKPSRDNKQLCVAILTDLSKTFDRICYDLLIAKLSAYVFDKKGLKLIYDYLNGRSQKIKVCSSFSSALDISYGVPQGSIIGPLLFNIDICDIVNYADDNTLYECDQHCDNLINNLELTVETYCTYCFQHNKLLQNAIFSYHFWYL